MHDLLSRLEKLGRRGLTVSIAYGPCGSNGELLYSVDLLSPDRQQFFDSPYVATSFEHAISIAENESKERGWVVN